MKKRLWILFIVSLTGYSSNAQEIAIHLSLQEAISASVSNNNAIRLAALDGEIATAAFRQTDAIFLPQVNFSYSAATTNNPLNAFGFKLQQQSITPADFEPKLLNNPSATTDFTTKIEWQQPLVNIDKLYQRKGAAKQVEVYQSILQRTKEHLSFETEKAYLQLQVLRDIDKVLKEAFVTSKAFHKTSEGYFEQGLIQKSDLMNAALHVMNLETQIKNSQSNIRDASDLLSLLMGGPAGRIYTTDPITQNINPLMDSLQLSGDRADFKALQKGMEGYDMMIRSSRSDFLPKLNAFASYQLNDKRMFGFNANSYFAGVRLTVNIFNGNYTKNVITRQNLEKDKLATQLDQQKREARVQINYAKHQLSDAVFSIKQQQAAVDQASEVLRVLQNRYTEGLVNTNDVLNAQTQVSQQKLGAVQAVFNYNLAAVYLQFLTAKK